MSNKLKQKIKDLYDTPLSEEEVKEATQNLVSFFELLIEEDKQEKKEVNNETTNKQPRKRTN